MGAKATVEHGNSFPGPPDSLISNTTPYQSYTDAERKAFEKLEAPRLPAAIAYSGRTPRLERGVRMQHAAGRNGRWWIPRGWSQTSPREGNAQKT